MDDLNDEIGDRRDAGIGDASGRRPRGTNARARGPRRRGFNGPAAARRTLRREVLAGAGALALAAGAQGFDLDDPEQAPWTFAAESVSAAEVTAGAAATGGAATYYNIQAPADDAALTTTSGVELSGSGTWYVRVDVPGMLFSADPELSASGGPPGAGFAPGEAAVVYGGAGTDAVVYRLPGGRDLPAGIAFRLALADALAVPGGEGAYDVRVGLYEAVAEAVSGTGGFGDAFGGERTLVVMARGVDVDIVNGRAVADAATGFTAFTPASASGRRVGADEPSAVLGSIAVALADRAPDGAARMLYAARGGARAGLDDLVEAVRVRIAGDMSFGIFDLRTGVGTDRCRSSTGEDVLALEPPAGRDEVTDSGVATLAAADGRFGTRHLCVRLLRPPSAIPVVRYRATVSVAPASGAADREWEGLVGEIRRSGTRVEIAQLTAWPGYDERIVIVNRSLLPARYLFMRFWPAAGVRAALTPAAALAEAEGANVVGPRAQVVLGTRETVAIARTAGEGGLPVTGATLVLNADHRDIDVVTIRTNRVDGSTDTVRYPARATVEPEDP